MYQSMCHPQAHRTGRGSGRRRRGTDPANTPSTRYHRRQPRPRRDSRDLPGTDVRHSRRRTPWAADGTSHRRIWLAPPRILRNAAALPGADPAGPPERGRHPRTSAPAPHTSVFEKFDHYRVVRVPVNV